MFLKTIVTTTYRYYLQKFKIAGAVPPFTMSAIKIRVDFRNPKTLTPADFTTIRVI